MLWDMPTSLLSVRVSRGGERSITSGVASYLSEISTLGGCVVDELVTPLPRILVPHFRAGTRILAPA
jgi:hypothetical protein